MGQMTCEKSIIMENMFGQTIEVPAGTLVSVNDIGWFFELEYRGFTKRVVRAMPNPVRDIVRSPIYLEEK